MDRTKLKDIGEAYIQQNINKLINKKTKKVERRSENSGKILIRFRNAIFRKSQVHKQNPEFSSNLEIANVEWAIRNSSK